MAKEIAEKPLAWRPGLMLRKSRWKSELKYSRVRERFKFRRIELPTQRTLPTGGSPASRFPMIRSHPIFVVTVP